MKKRICEQCGEELTPISVKVKTLIACPHKLRSCGRTWFVDGREHWMPKVYWQLPDDE